MQELHTTIAEFRNADNKSSGVSFGIILLQEPYYLFSKLFFFFLQFCCNLKTKMMACPYHITNTRVKITGMVACKQSVQTGNQ